MSLFLGKIHYWLFNKIIWFENIEEDIVSIAKEKEIYTEALALKIKEKYEEKLPKLPLEEMIDISNIHGWLQNRINLAEGRIASWITAILKKDENSIEDLEKIFIAQGIKAAKEVKSSEREINNAIDIFNSINDYILDGMPCDRVNEIINESEDEVLWRRTMCVHKSIWNEVSGDVDVFYILRNKWIESFVKEINDEFEYIEAENMSIRRK